jgi:hypothetical protein
VPLPYRDPDPDVQSRLEEVARPELLGHVFDLEAARITSLVEKYKLLVDARIQETKAAHNRYQAGSGTLEDWEKEKEKLLDATRALVHYSREKQLGSSNLLRFSESLNRTTSQLERYTHAMTEVVRQNAEFRLTMLASVDALNAAGRATTSQMQRMDQMREGIRLTREEYSRFQQTIRQAAEIGINTEQLDELTQRLQAVYGQERGLDIAQRAVTMETNAPGAIRAATTGTEREVIEAQRGRGTDEKDVIRAIYNATQLRTPTGDARMTRDLATSRMILDDIRTDIGNLLQRFVGPFAASYGPALLSIAGHSAESLLSLAQIIITLRALSITGGATGATSGIGALLSGTGIASLLARARGIRGGGKIAAITGLVATAGLAYYAMSRSRPPEEGEDEGGAVPARPPIGGAMSMAGTGLPFGPTAPARSEGASGSFAVPMAMLAAPSLARGAMRAMGRTPGTLATAAARGVNVAGWAGLGVDLVGSYYEDKLRRQGNTQGAAVAGGVAGLGSVAGYGALGATVGSVVPGAGTAIGGAIGAAVGAFLERDRLRTSVQQTVMQRGGMVRSFLESDDPAVRGARNALTILPTGVGLLIPILQRWGQELDRNEDILQRSRSRAAELAEAFQNTVPTMEAFQRQLQGAASLARTGVPQALATEAAARAPLAAQSGGIAGPRLVDLQRVEAEGGRQQLRQFIASVAPDFERQRAAVRLIQDTADREVAEATREQSESRNVVRTEVRAGRGDSEVAVRARENEQAAGTRLEAATNARRATEEPLRNIQANEALYEAERLARVNEINEAASVERLHQQMVQLLESRVAPLRGEARLRQEQLNLVGTILGTDQRVLAVQAQRNQAAREDVRNTQEQREELARGYQQRVAGLHAQRAEGTINTDAELTQRLEVERLRFVKGDQEFRSRIIAGYQDQIQAFRDTVTGVAQRIQQSGAFRTRAAQQETLTTGYELEATQGLSGAQVEARMGPIADLAQQQADALTEALSATVYRIQKQASARIGEINRDTTLDDTTRQEQVAVVQTEANTQALSAYNDALKAQHSALQLAIRAITEAADAERRRIGTQREVTETQRGLAEYLGMSYATQLSMQQDILRAKVQERQLTLTEMERVRRTVEESGASAENNQRYQELEKRAAQETADIIRSSVQVQRDFLDKALGRVFGVSSGTRAQPGFGQQGFANRAMFGQHMEVGGLRIPGIITPEEQQRQLRAVLPPDLLNRPVGGASIGALPGRPLEVARPDVPAPPGFRSVPVAPEPRTPVREPVDRVEPAALTPDVPEPIRRRLAPPRFAPLDLPVQEAAPAPPGFRSIPVEPERARPLPPPTTPPDTGRPSPDMMWGGPLSPDLRRKMDTLLGRTPRPEPVDRVEPETPPRRPAVLVPDVPVPRAERPPAPQPLDIPLLETTPPPPRLRGREVPAPEAPIIPVRPVRRGIIPPVQPPDTLETTPPLRPTAPRRRGLRPTERPGIELIRPPTLRPTTTARRTPRPPEPPGTPDRPRGRLRREGALHPTPDIREIRPRRRMDVIPVPEDLARPRDAGRTLPPTRVARDPQPPFPPRVSPVGLPVGVPPPVPAPIPQPGTATTGVTPRAPVVVAARTVPPTVTQPGIAPAVAPNLTAVLTPAANAMRDAAASLNRVVAAMPANRATPAGEKLDISGKITVEVSLKSDLLEARIRQKVLTMVRTGEIMSGARGM